MTVALVVVGGVLQMAAIVAGTHRMLPAFALPLPTRVAVAERITEVAADRSVMLTPPSLHHTPERYRRPDGPPVAPAKPHPLHDQHAPRRRSAGVMSRFPGRRGQETSGVTHAIVFIRRLLGVVNVLFDSGVVV
jgi:hypothetical protein